MLEAEDARRFDFVCGQVQALLGFAAAVIYSHHSIASLGVHLERAQEAILARAEQTPISDHFLNGMSDVREKLRALVAAASEQSE